MSKNNNSDENETKQYFNRIKEIDEMEFKLRNERSLLLQERAWYTKPSSWIGILAIIVPILLFALNYTIGQYIPINK